MSTPAIRVEGLSKRYRIGLTAAPYGRLTETLWEGARSLLRRPARANGASEVWALRDVSMTIDEGEVVGIVGPNGAGKTTLLKILSRITEPTEGSAELRGRVGSLLEVGTGFHPELTGRENVFLNGAILGMGRAEIKGRFDEIVSFSEMERFIETPVKYYSTGMQVRLAFSVAAHLEPEILLVDEVLAVGDAAFQRKCLGRIGEISRAGRTVLLVSHQMAAVLALCSKAYLMTRGLVSSQGPPRDVIAKYLGDADTASKVAVGNRTDRSGPGWARVTEIAFGTADRMGGVTTGFPCRIAVTCESSVPVANVRIAIGLYDRLGQQLALLDTLVSSDIFQLVVGTNRLVCEIPRLTLYPGEYLLNVAILQGEDVIDHVVHAAKLNVDSGDFFGSGRLPEYGPLIVDHKWLKG